MPLCLCASVPLCLKVCKRGCGSIEAPSRGEPKPGPLGPDFYLLSPINIILKNFSSVLIRTTFSTYSYLYTKERKVNNLSLEDIKMKTLSPTMKRRLEIQGFTETDPGVLEETAPWLGFSYGLCAVLAAVGVILASPVILLGLTFFSGWGAASPVHPFDYIYNYGIRHATGTGPFPKRGVPGRFACGLGTVWLVVTAWSFYAGMMHTGYILGALLVVVALLVSTTHFCIPSLTYRSIFGFPPETGDDEGLMCKTGILCNR